MPEGRHRSAVLSPGETRERVSIHSLLCSMEMMQRLIPRTRSGIVRSGVQGPEEEQHECPQVFFGRVRTGPSGSERHSLRCPGASQVGILTQATQTAEVEGRSGPWACKPARMAVNNETLLHYNHVVLGAPMAKRIIMQLMGAQRNHLRLALRDPTGSLVGLECKAVLNFRGAACLQP